MRSTERATGVHTQHLLKSRG